MNSVPPIAKQPETEVTTFKNAAGLSITRLSVSNPEKKQSATVEVYHYGAHVTKWEESNRAPFLFLSKKAILDGSKAIRGGIPIVFPQFGPMGPLKQHGFARSTVWKLVSSSTLKDTAEAQFSLENGPHSQDWPHEFKFTYKVSLKGARDSTLTCHMRVQNTGKKNLSFTTALHTYFNISDITKTNVQAGVDSIKGVKYIDQLQDGKTLTADSDSIAFDAEVDRIYMAIPNQLKVVDPGTKRSIHLVKENLPDAVVWNPHIAKSQKMADFGNEEYKTMVCVEAGTVKPAAVVPAGETWTASLTLSHSAM